ncbi:MULTISPECIES: VOC family protein [Guptibacillus]|uniref:VOC family protein n=1 Tax=Guptibacillus TaxID=3421338 RepID=UPI0030811B3A
MATELWMNLPVKDLDKSKAFFHDIGFSVQSIGDGVQVGIQGSNVMLFPEARFETFAQSS